MPDSVPPLTIRLAVRSDLPAIFEILNREIRDGINIFETRPMEGQAQETWWNVHPPERYPVFVAESEKQVVGWSSLSAYSGFCGYNGTAEASIWIVPAFHGRGIGTRLYQNLFQAGRKNGLRVVLARVESQNRASIALHHRHGFREVGVLRGVGEKFGRLLDVVLFEKQLQQTG
jgi:phosphinothricin acetyltransferase